jgi:hypothetical protein
MVTLLSAVVSSESVTELLDSTDTVVQCGNELLVYGDTFDEDGRIVEWHFWVSL